MGRPQNEAHPKESLKNKLTSFGMAPHNPIPFFPSLCLLEAKERKKKKKNRKKEIKGPALRGTYEQSRLRPDHLLPYQQRGLIARKGMLDEQRQKKKKEKKKRKSYRKLSSFRCRTYEPGVLCFFLFLPAGCSLCGSGTQRERKKSLQVSKRSVVNQWSWQITRNAVLVFTLKRPQRAPARPTKCSVRRRTKERRVGGQRNGAKGKAKGKQEKGKKGN